MGLNSGQQSAFIDLISFTNAPNEKYMALSGGAGTGKTYFISKVAESIIRHAAAESGLHTVEVTATTNKAAAVIAEAMPNHHSEIKTIYAFMNLRVSENFRTGEVKCIPTAKWVVHSGIFLVIDECSMVNKELMSYLDKGLDSSCKVLFVGDKNQLAPIKEMISPIYANNYRTAYLTEPVRNAEQPALMELCEQAKKTVETGIFTPIIPVPGVIDYVDGNTLRGILEREYHSENPMRRILSYTNKRVMEYNTFIREMRGYTEPFVEGEILVNNSSIELAGKQRMYTDQVVKVVSIMRAYLDSDVLKGYDIAMIEMSVEDITTGSTYVINCFADPEERSDVIKYYSNNKIWDRYFKVKNTFPDLRSVAASTTHKAQGSTYESVIVDLTDIGKSTNKGQTARMQYVALSRPKKRLYIRGELPKRYFE